MKKFIPCPVLFILLACNAGSHEARVMAAKEIAARQFAAAESRWPGVTQVQLDSGATIYMTKCLKCHGNFSLTYFSEARWNYELGRMTYLADLSPDEALQVKRYILSLRDVEIDAAH